MISPNQEMVCHPRIIWIVLDELSYQQTYEHRFHNLNLPAFDQLAKQSTVFTGVVPAGIMTEIAMPSLLAGLAVDQIHPSSDGVRLKIHNPLTKRWLDFDQHDTVFSDALAARYHTAIAGWYNPYCRTLPEVLDSCYWTLGLPAPNKMLPRASTADNIFNPLLLSSSVMDHLPFAIVHGNNAEDTANKPHILDYQLISDSADQLLRDPAFDFILIHMSVPHPGGIYNRTKHILTTRNSTYIDNLALADAYLGHVRSLLEAKGQWDSSAIVIMGDHSWRTELLWAANADWTPEEQEASNGGRFDDRPGYIVKLPKQKVGTTIDIRFPAVNTRSLLDAIMAKQIVSPQDLASWVTLQGQKRMPN
ncbi:sulfatase-like hydrolase/transferase [Granulicella aggregans]|uniref:sulfatase-like hydrolase/transferase n=1 Tax=Granulicella aggregans TaxID=474949 RepID=UPI0021E0C1BC|nr:sulfatase-like hydrolase/transferase [Granulicella aggregans]